MRDLDELSLQNHFTVHNSFYITQLKFDTIVLLEESRIAEYPKFPEGFLSFLLLTFYLRQSNLHIKYLVSEWSSDEVKNWGGGQGNGDKEMKKQQARTIALVIFWTQIGLCMQSLCYSFSPFYNSQNPQIPCAIST